MAKLDLQLDCNELTVQHNRTGVSVTLENVDTYDLVQNEDLIKLIEIEDYINAIGEDTLRAHIEKYYDWFE